MTAPSSIAHLLAEHHVGLDHHVLAEFGIGAKKHRLGRNQRDAGIERGLCAAAAARRLRLRQAAFLVLMPRTSSSSTSTATAASFMPRAISTASVK